ncbi:MAG: SulP family inorganic anion transporter [Vicinamibacterales bacterium]
MSTQPSRTSSDQTGGRQAPAAASAPWRADLLAGTTTGVVALPLALAFGEASGAGPMAGLWGAIVLGFVASLLGGTPTLASGPTGPMVVVFAGVFSALGGDPAQVFAAVVLGGVLQVVMGLAGVGHYIKLVPYPVVSGFMSGIGAVIIALQVARLFGHEPDGGGTIPALAAIPRAIADPKWPALAVGGLALLTVFAWPRRWARAIPASLAALVLGTAVSSAIAGAPLLGDIPTGWPPVVIPRMSADSLLLVLEAAAILAALGSLDTLLTSLVADNLTGTRHDSRRELIGQGVGNALAGLLGALPGAGATMRTVVNIRAGARTRISGMTHAVVLLAVVLVLAPLAARIPHAVLAGILVKVGYDIIDWTYIRRAHRGPRWDLLLMALVLALTVFVDLITAVAAGVVLAALAFVKQLADVQIAARLESPDGGLTPAEARTLSRLRGRLTWFTFADGPLSFGAAADLGHHVRERARDGGTIALDFTTVPFLDVSAAMAVRTILVDAHAVGRRVWIVGANADVRRISGTLDIDRAVSSDERFATRAGRPCRRPKGQAAPAPCPRASAAAAPTRAPHPRR